VNTVLQAVLGVGYVGPAVNVHSSQNEPILDVMVFIVVVDVIGVGVAAWSCQNRSKVCHTLFEFFLDQYP